MPFVTTRQFFFGCVDDLITSRAIGRGSLRFGSTHDDSLIDLERLMLSFGLRQPSRLTASSISASYYFSFLCSRAAQVFKCQVLQKFNKDASYTITWPSQCLKIFKNVSFKLISCKVFKIILPFINGTSKYFYPSLMGHLSIFTPN